MAYVPICEEEGEEPVEMPVEENGTILLSTLQAQFPNACGLQCLNEETKTTRGVRLNEGHFYPPGKSGWGTQIYHCVFPKENKRKSDDYLENPTAKTKKFENRIRCTDLIVLGLSFKTTEESLREYFEKFGEVIMSQVKRDFKTGESKGFGFIRFAKYEPQVRVLAARHMIDDRMCEVKIPNSKEGVIQQLPSKIFVGRCTEDISSEDLREYFSKFGEVTDVFIPQPFRAFSFVTFLDSETAQSLCGEDHIIKGVSVYVSNAAPKTERNRNGQRNFNNYNINNSNSNNVGGQMMSRNNNQRGSSYANEVFGGFGTFHPSTSNCSMNGGGANPYGANGNNHSSNNNGSTWNNNIQTFGQNSSNSVQSQNLATVRMNPAIVAAALNQWGLLNGSFHNHLEQDQGGGSNQSWLRKSDVSSAQFSDQISKFSPL